MSVLFSVENHVARVTIDRPDVLNAVDLATQAELIRIWEAIEKNRDVRVVVLTGAGERAFCTGADMKGSSGMSGLEYWAAPRPGGFGGIALRETLNVPVIARVNGHALGGGMEMVLGCDIVVAAEHAQFGLTEPRVGRIPFFAWRRSGHRRTPQTAAGTTRCARALCGSHDGGGVTRTISRVGAIRDRGARRRRLCKESSRPLRIS